MAARQEYMKTIETPLLIHEAYINVVKPLPPYSIVETIDRNLKLSNCCKVIAQIAPQIYKFDVSAPSLLERPIKTSNYIQRLLIASMVQTTQPKNSLILQLSLL